MLLLHQAKTKCCFHVSIFLRKYSSIFTPTALLVWMTSLKQTNYVAAKSQRRRPTFTRRWKGAETPGEPGSQG